MTTIAIQGLGTYLPGDGVSNEDIFRRYGPFVATLSEELGVARRHWCIDPDTGVPQEDNAGIATRAAERALADAGLGANDIDLIIVATVSADYMFPGPAAFVQDRLGATRATVLDLRAGCFGFAQGLSIARQFLLSGAVRHVLLIGSEVFSPLLHTALRRADCFRPRQRTMLRVTAALFGDGAGALVLGRGTADAQDRVLDCHTYSVGCGRAPGILGAVGGVRMPFLDPQNCRDTRVMEHDYAAIDRFLSEVAHRLFDSFGEHLAAALEAVALIVPAQANGRIRETLTNVLRERCADDGLAQQTQKKIFVDIADVGNTGAASIYIALDKIRCRGALRPGEKLLLVPAEATKWFYGIIELVH